MTKRDSARSDTHGHPPAVAELCELEEALKNMEDLRHDKVLAPVGDVNHQPSALPTQTQLSDLLSHTAFHTHVQPKLVVSGLIYNPLLEVQLQSSPVRQVAEEKVKRVPVRRHHNVQLLVHIGLVCTDQLKSPLESVLKVVVGTCCGDRPIKKIRHRTQNVILLICDLQMVHSMPLERDPGHG